MASEKMSRAASFWLAGEPVPGLRCGLVSVREQPRRATPRGALGAVGCQLDKSLLLNPPRQSGQKVCLTIPDLLLAFLGASLGFA